MLRTGDVVEIRSGRGKGEHGPIVGMDVQGSGNSYIIDTNEGHTRIIKEHKLKVLHRISDADFYGEYAADELDEYGRPIL